LTIETEKNQQANQWDAQYISKLSQTKLSYSGDGKFPVSHYND